MKAIVCAALLAMLAPVPVLAQSMSPPETPSDRYNRERTEENRDQQAQTPDQRDSGEIETLRREHMSSPNVEGQRAPENPATGVPEPQRPGGARQDEGGIRP